MSLRDDTSRYHCNLISVFLGVVATILCCSAIAEQYPAYRSESPVYSFDLALAHLWETHPDVESGLANLSAHNQDVRAAYVGFMPYLTLDMQEGERLDSYTARVILPVYRGGGTLASVRGAKADEQGAIAGLQQTRLELGLELVDLWVSLSAVHEQEALWLGYIDSLRELEGVIKRRAEGGAAPQSEVLSATARIQQADAQAAINRSQIEAKQAQLMTLLKLPPFYVTWPDESLWHNDEEVFAALHRAEKEHPEIVFAETRVKASEAERSLSRSQLMPEIFIQHDKSFGSSSLNELDSEEATRLVLRYQTDSGLKGWFSSKAGDQRIHASRMAVDAAKRSVIAEIKVAQAERMSALMQLSYQSDAVNGASAVVESFLRQFEVGRKTWLEVLNAQRELHETKLQLVQVKERLWSAELRLALHGLDWARLLPLPEQEQQVLRD